MRTGRNRQVKTPKSGLHRARVWLRSVERKILRVWIDFSHRHQNSHLLPFALFGIIFCDGFLVFIPSTFILIASVTISPNRWWFFAFVFAAAAATNNAATYAIGRALPVTELESWISFLHIGDFYSQAQGYLQKYGAFAGFLCALMFLPTQLITGVLGVNDAHLLKSGEAVSSTFVQTVLFVFAGHLLKSLVFCAITRYGWLKLERKFERGEI